MADEESAAEQEFRDYTSLVLLVDDQVIVGEAVRQALAHQPHLDFHFCTNADEAMELAQRIRPTVILQDLVMPGTDGLTLLRRYRSDPITKDIPVIVLSSKEEPAVKSRAFEQGANDYLVKLPDPIELIARIRCHSRAYLNQIQRDEAYAALRQSQKRLLEMNIELQRLNNVDGLTGLSNRRYFNECLVKEWKRAAREKSELGILMIDVDNFKAYNDHYGHLSGDEVLKKVASIIKDGAARSSDLAARFGGEEFAVILASTELAGAQYVAEKMRAGVEFLGIPHEGATASGCVTISVGLATTVPDHELPVLALVEASDIALYDAKRGGRNRIMVYSASSLPRVDRDRPPHSIGS